MSLGKIYLLVFANIVLSLILVGPLSLFSPVKPDSFDLIVLFYFILLGFFVYQVVRLRFYIKSRILSLEGLSIFDLFHL